MLFRFGKIDSPLYSFCKTVDETPTFIIAQKLNFFEIN